MNKVPAVKYFILFFISSFLLLISCSETDISSKSDKVESLLKTADSYDVKSEKYFQLADSAYRMALHINSLNSDLIEKSLLYQANHYFSIYKYDEAVDKFNLVIKFHRSSPPTFILGDAYHGLARTYYRLDRDSLSISYFKKAANTRYLAGDSAGYGTSLNSAGYVFWTNSSFDSALTYFEKALSVREKQDNKSFLASTLNNIGTIYYNWSIYNKALDNYTRVLDLVKAAGDTSAEANVLSNIGLIYLNTKQPENARDYFRESLKYAKLVNDQNRISYALTNLASSFLESNIDSALHYFDKSNQVYLAIGFIGGQLLAKEGMGKCYLKTGRFNDAKKEFEDIRKLSLQENIRVRYAFALHFLGEIESKSNNISKAIKLFEQSNSVAEQINVKSVLVDNYRYMSELFEKTGNIAGAFKATKAYLTFKNELENEEINRRLTESKKQFEMEKVNRMMEATGYENDIQRIILFSAFSIILVLIISIVVLYRINIKKTRTYKLLADRNILIESQKEELHNANIDLQTLTKTKERIFSIIAHDLKNPFITLHGYTELLKNDFEQLSDSEKIEYITELETVTNKTYTLLENLLELSSLKSGKLRYDPNDFNLRNNVTQIIDFFKTQAKSKGIKIVNKIPPNLEVLADKTMVETVLRNLLSNAIKFSLPGGTVRLLAQEEKEEILISVEDKGIGMKEDLLRNMLDHDAIVSTRGTNDEKGSGLGIEICKEFVKTHNGNFWAESEPGKGSTFYFTLPKSVQLNSILTS